MPVEIVKLKDEPTKLSGNMLIPAVYIPSFRLVNAIEKKADKRMLIQTTGGLGDVICAEPSIRYALKHFKNTEIYVSSWWPELFNQSGITKVFDIKALEPEWDDYFHFKTIYEPDHLSWEFINHMAINPVDYVSINLWRMLLPFEERHIELTPSFDDELVVDDLPICLSQAIIIHPGKTWASRTLPKEFWNKVIKRILEKKRIPVIIGSDSMQDRGTVDVDPTGCHDLRNSLSIMETVALLQSASVLLTNDSAPIHMAASGDASIGYISTVKHPDYLKHFRNGKCGWEMVNFSQGGLWQNFNLCPNNPNATFLHEVDEKTLNSWLPEPEMFADWGISCL